MNATQPHADERPIGLLSPPSNVDAEQALLGALLLNNGVANEVGGFLKADHFFQPVHGRIFDACLELVGRGSIANPVTLKHIFEGDEDLAEVGGVGYLAQLAGAAVTIINARSYSRVLLDLWARRRIIEIASEAAAKAHAVQAGQPVDAVMAELVEAVDVLHDTLNASDGGAQTLVQIYDAVVSASDAAYRTGGRITGVSSGLSALDDLLGGFQPGELIIGAARPGMGKTALGLQIAEHAARRGQRVAFFSLEMPSAQLVQRLIAMRTGISANAIRRGDLDADRMAAIMAEREAIEALPLILDDMPHGCTVAGLGATARRLHARRPLGLVVVDYIGLIKPSNEAARRNRVDEITEISGGLKRLAKSLGVPVLALCQLNRALEARENKRPGLSDLRDSGSIEQDADVVIFIHRAVEFLRRSPPDEKKDGKAYDDWLSDVISLENKAELIVAKHRQGPTGHLKVFYDPQRTRFYDAVGRA